MQGSEDESAGPAQLVGREILEAEASYRLTGDSGGHHHTGAAAGARGAVLGGRGLKLTLVSRKKSIGL